VSLPHLFQWERVGAMVKSLGGTILFPERHPKDLVRRGDVASAH